MDSLGRLDILALVVDASQDEPVRLAALATLVECLPAGHPYRLIPVQRLYDRLKEPWETRAYLVNGRAVKRLVQRPPVSILDIL